MIKEHQHFNKDSESFEYSIGQIQTGPMPSPGMLAILYVLVSFAAIVKRVQCSKVAKKASFLNKNIELCDRIKIKMIINISMLDTAQL